ncbi:cytochrome P450 family protein [Nocardia arthritidis]|uniref:Cytochrome P450 n=1 Tax=Nocardia arthritidis TaxID=228602 RepID=A0A6G9YKF9_9NOCA|nr:cytochrome P450 [Nocardia arthritidis]QIS13692.1 cytochrome P450 [Nocardia arthritidis]
MKRLTQDFFHTPHAIYDELRAEGPVHHVILPTGLPAWLVVEYDAVREVLRNPTVRKDPYSPEGIAAREAASGLTVSDAVVRKLNNHMLNADPPTHTRLRKLVTPAFAPARMEELAPRIRAITDELLDRIAGTTGTVDLLGEFAFPLPVTVICELLGLPVEDRDDFREWSAAVIDSPAVHKDEVERVTVTMIEYFERLIARRRVEGLGDDLVSQLIAATDDGDRLNDEELISTIFLILVAGHETTVNLIGNTVLTLLSDPARYRAVHDNPDAVPQLIEEMLRYNGPVNIATWRYTTEPITLGGTEIPAGELVLAALGSANHDEHRYADAAEFDPARGAANHVAFGYGIHFCLGAGLARMEGRIAITQLVQRFPDMRLAADADPRWRESTLIRGLHDLRVELAGAPALR